MFLYEALPVKSKDICVFCEEVTKKKHLLEKA